MTIRHTLHFLRQETQWVATVVSNFLKVRSARRQLLRLDDRTLHDMGITRPQIDFVTQLPLPPRRSSLPRHEPSRHEDATRMGWTRTMNG